MALALAALEQQIAALPSQVWKTSVFRNVVSMPLSWC